MIPITIDISDLAQQLEMTKVQVEAYIPVILDSIAAKLKEKWTEKAKQELHTSREQYISSIYIKPDGPNVRIIGLPNDKDNWLSIAVEQGMNAFDLKENFKKSGKARRKKDGGWYLTVPFRHANPAAVTEGMFATVMPEDVYRVAKRLRPNQQINMGKLPKQYQEVLSRPAFSAIETARTYQSFNPSNPLTRYTHQSPVYAGLQKNTKKHHAGYVTFRRASDVSDPNSWIHTGITAHNLAQKTVNEFNLTAEIVQIKNELLKN